MQELLENNREILLANEETKFLYLYTPLCGTCQVAGKMLSVVEQLLPQHNWLKADLNYVPTLAEQYSIESVPCLLVLRNNELVKKIYAFQSVPFLYESLRSL
ncbi:thioredoxin family protein [Robertmurraya korlensis]|jgi:thioredoxin 1|uniref:thioredoxin family protein n=1 Tax=Robertmurraya korlensis TaxID=519977 RepID=UPI0008255438|nr:thioredoxin family protein [Robertmurraya korlensis]